MLKHLHEVTLVLNPFGKTSEVCHMRNHQAFSNARREKIVSPHIIDTVKGSIFTLVKYPYGHGSLTGLTKNSSTLLQRI